MIERHQKKAYDRNNKNNFRDNGYYSSSDFVRNGDKSYN